ncbi:MAG: hypothetical protein AABX73_02335 [Nanoarchaeota archaeon]
MVALEYKLDAGNSLLDSCGNCGAELYIPRKLDIEVRKMRSRRKRPVPIMGQHEGVYVSHGGYYYCSHKCVKDYTD